MTPLFDALAGFHRAHPGIGISLLEDASDQLFERLRCGAADLCLVGYADGDPPAGLGTHPIVRERLVAAVPDSHPLCAAGRVTLDDVRRHPVVCLPEGTGIRAVFDRACTARGVHPAIAFQAAAPARCWTSPRAGWAWRSCPSRCSTGPRAAPAAHRRRPRPRRPRPRLAPHASRAGRARVAPARPRGLRRAGVNSHSPCTIRSAASQAARSPEGS